jgi:hypothetical protein
VDTSVIIGSPSTGEPSPGVRLSVASSTGAQGRADHWERTPCWGGAT